MEYIMMYLARHAHGVGVHTLAGLVSLVALTGCMVAALMGISIYHQRLKSLPAVVMMMVVCGSFAALAWAVDVARVRHVLALNISVHLALASAALTMVSMLWVPRSWRRGVAVVES